MPARGLNGEAYRGHVFWDELYVYPFLSLRLPEVTRGLLMYRYRRLEEARAAAREAGFSGRCSRGRAAARARRRRSASISTRSRGAGSPTSATTSVMSTPPSSTTSGTTSRPPGTSPFLRDYGAEMMLEIARFWASIAHFNPERERYEIHGVMGPDEFHEKYPGAPEGGLRNNAYTNVMVAWLCGLAGEVLSLLPASRAEALRTTARALGRGAAAVART